MSRADMLRETCPSDLEQVDLPPAGRPPSAWVLFAPPLVIFFIVVLLAALHTFLGSPLGSAWNAELWETVKVWIAPTIAATAFGAYVRRQNADNLAQLRGVGPAAALEDSEDAPPPRARVRQTGPHALRSGRHRVVEAEPYDEDEEDGPW
jgi:hypothetical protein